MRKTILLTNSGGSFGRSMVLALGKAGHVVYAGLHRLFGASHIALLEAVREAGIDLRIVDLDVLSQASVDAAVAHVIHDTGQLDVLVHNSGYQISGPAEAFSAEQLAHLYDINVLSTQSVNRAVIPQFRRQRHGLIVWVSSISSAGNIPPYLAPYFSKASMDHVARIYAQELGEAGIDCCTVLPRWIRGTAGGGGARIDPSTVGDVIGEIVDLPSCERPLRVFVHCRDAVGQSDKVNRRLTDAERQIVLPFRQRRPMRARQYAPGIAIATHVKP